MTNAWLKLALCAIAASVTLSACSSSSPVEGSAPNPIEIPGVELPGLDQLPEAQRAAFADGTISTVEYSSAYREFELCANADGKLAVVEPQIDPVSGYISYGIFEDVGGSIEDPSSASGRCYEDDFHWIELVWELTDPTNVEVQRSRQLDQFNNEARPCLEANGVDVPAEIEVGSDVFGQFFVEYGTLVNAGKC